MKLLYLTSRGHVSAVHIHHLDFFKGTSSQILHSLLLGKPTFTNRLESTVVNKFHKKSMSLVLKFKK